MDLREENRKLLELYEPLRVADVRDGMDWMGYHHYGTLDREIRPLWRTRACGIARTARYLPFEGPAPLLRGDAYTEWSNNYYNTIATYPWMQEIEDGDMIVLDMSGVDVGLMGSDNTLSCLAKGARGIITNGGGIRDSDECILQKVPIWCRFVSQKMDQAKLEDTVNEIKKLNDKAVVITTPWDDLTGKQILDAIMGKDNLEVFELATKHHEEEEAEHHHHDHDHDEHDHGEHEHEHHHDHDEHDHEGHEHHHHHHHADDIFTTWGRETPHKFTKETIENALKTLADSDDYGYIVRSKGIVPAEDGTWIYFDLVDGEYEIRTGEPDVTGKLVVIGTDVVEDKVAELFGL